MSTIVVTTLVDESNAAETVSNPQGAGLSLREALALANAGDTITFAADLIGGTTPGVNDGRVVLTQGALAISSDVTIEGDLNGDHKADITLDGNNAGTVLAVLDGDFATRISATLDGLVITHGYTYDGGGGIYVGTNDALTLTHSTVADNSAGTGGGIFGQALASITVTDSTISGNSAAGFLASGGGISIQSGASLALTNATLSGNSASYDGGAVFGFQDNGITLVNTTVTGNQAGNEGGGVYDSGLVVTLVNSIAAGNMAGLTGDDLIGSATLPTLALVGGNVLGSGPVNFVQVPDGPIALIDGTSGAALGTVFASVAADPHTGVLSGVLSDNGGPVATVALAAVAANPALDGGSDSAIGAPPTDARGLARVDVPSVAHNDANITDIGAFELRGAFETPSLVVTTAADVVDLFDGKTSLREAIAYANSLPGADTITFDPALAGETLLLTQGALAITSNLMIEGDIDGDHKADITIDGNHAGGVFTIDDGNSGARVSATLDGLVITHGAAVDAGGGVNVGVNDALTLTHSTVSDNSVTGDFASGGGIAGQDHSSIVLTDSTVSGNSATGQLASGGGVSVQTGASVTLTNVTLSGNSASFDGGAVFDLQNSTITLVNTTVTGNHAGYHGGGVYDFGPLATVTLVNAIAAGNTADGAGDDLACDSNGSPSTLVLTGGNILGSAPVNFAQVIDAPAATIDGASAAELGTVFANVAPDAHTGVLAGVLADNGGPVATVALAASAANPALDGGSDSAAGVPAADARGLAHVDAVGIEHNGANITDIGAYELQVETPSLVVTTLSDVVDPLDGKTSLREAIAYANAHLGADTITFAAALAGGTLSLTQGQLEIASDVTIEGDINGDRTGDITIDAGGASRVLSVDSGTALLDGLTIAGGNTSGEGGGLDIGALTTSANVTLSNSLVIGNDARVGGGVAVGVGSTLHLVNSTVTDNTAAYAGGGIANQGTLNAVDATLSGNHGLGGTGTAIPSAGGGLYNTGAAILADTTISGNGSGDLGGGIANAGDLVLTNVTVADNAAPTHGGGLYNIVAVSGGITINDSTFSGNIAGIGGGIDNAAGSVTLTNSIVAANLASNGSDVLSDASGSLVLNGHDILGSMPVGSVVSTDGTATQIDATDPAALETVFAQVGVNPHTGVLTGVLANNGGPVATIAIAAGGLAVDTGSNADLPADSGDLDGDNNTAEVLPVDARGLPRVSGGSVDIGAYELQNTPPHQVADNPLVLDEGARATISAALLSYTDQEQAATDVTFTITGAVTVGALQLDGAALGVGATFTQADIDAGRLGYAHDGSETASASFGFSVSDGAGGVVDAQSFTIAINPVNDPPVVGPQLKLPSIDANSGAHLITQAQLLANATDVDGPTLAAINLQIASGAGTLVDNHDGSWSYTGAVNDATSVTFSYQVTDGIAAPVADSAILAIVPTPAQAAPQIGTGGDDTFTAPAGNSAFDGLGGVDTIILGFKLTDATVTYSGNHVIIDGPSSHTVLSGFEKYVFTDGTVNNADGDPLVDDLFYYARNHDVWNAHVDADAHYHAFGWKEGRDPDAFFSTSTYLSMHPDVKAAGIDPLVQFDLTGWKSGADPSIFFDTNAYLNANPDVKAAGVDPLAHFLADGAQEGRQPIAPGALLAPNGFDYVYYLQHNPDVAAAHIDPLQHFETIGWKEGRNPNAYFDTSGYLAHYADVAGAGINPLDQYDRFGWKEGRDPSVTFDTKHYLAAYPDVAATQVDPLVHFLEHGMQEGRSSFADGDWG